MHYISSGENACVGRPDYLAIKANARRFDSMHADSLRGTLLPVRKSLTKKSGIIGLFAFVGQDSLVYGGEAETPG